jgi:hypothetical protein
MKSPHIVFLSLSHALNLISFMSSQNYSEVHPVRAVALCQDTNCTLSPRLAHTLWNRTCSERSPPLTVRSNSKKPDHGETTVGAHPDVAAPHRPVFDGAGSHRVDIGVLVGNRSINGTDGDEAPGRTSAPWPRSRWRSAPRSAVLCLLSDPHPDSRSSSGRRILRKATSLGELALIDVCWSFEA